MSYKMKNISSSNISFKPSCTSLSREDFSGSDCNIYKLSIFQSNCCLEVSPFAKGEQGGFKTGINPYKGI